jgi:hypothetical protein
LRALFLLLLLANLLFLAWTRWVAPTGSPTPSSASAVESPLRPIRLRQEVQAAGTAPMGTTPAATDAGIAAASCVSVGPYADQAQADAAAAALQRMGFAARLRTATDEVRVGAWVRVIDLATPADASNAQVALQAAGLAGATVVPDDVSLNVVSVGVYADPQRAAEVADSVTRAGFKPQLSDRLRTMDVFWLDVDRQANGGIPELGDAGPVADSGLPLELRVCPSSPVSVPAPTGPGTAAPTG